MTPLPWRWLGRVAYAEAVERMDSRRDRVVAGEPGAECVLLCEHPPTITLGRSAGSGAVVATAAQLKAEGVDVVRVSRGGEATYHGPGQLMIYPVARLSGHTRSVTSFLQAVAEALAAVAGELGAAGARWRRDPAGLWLGERKLAACGIHVHRRVVTHGFAFNIDTPPARWQLIDPCGLGATTPISLAEATGVAPPSVADIANRVGPAVAAALDCRSGVA